ncbi:MarR family transcriptional regulator [Curtobacterium sp. MCPF17_047]|uniref:MarR family winged helix-turn-helix transcriptional regulator n=1 Tax=unclassified Curtobacterium TaxID=257496 RepID=UPI000DA6EE0D|nr:MULTISPECIES: MarR family winged helix-turn-helix transcriptional regulator [unclassified Curtobacterium]PZE62283.1 MarR family transcriptional regulator [Curtobacterium sp. MCPF17_001]PZF68297.1 MarR family transcriptional regulator [Curtobacterium sp. MCPF17_047]
MTSSGTPPTAGDDGFPDGLEARVGVLERQFAALFSAYRTRLRQQATDVDPALQPSGFRTLQELVDRGPVGAGELAESLGFDKSVLSRQLRQLESLGLVSRGQDPADRRAVVISPTDDAVARMERIRTGARDEFRTNLAEWPTRDLDELARLLANLWPR